MMLGLFILYYFDFEIASFHVGMVYFLNTFCILSRAGIDAGVQSSLAKSSQGTRKHEEIYFLFSLISIFISIILLVFWYFLYGADILSVSKIKIEYYVAAIINIQILQSLMIYFNTITKFYKFLMTSIVKITVFYIATLSECGLSSNSLLTIQIGLSILIIGLIFHRINIIKYFIKKSFMMEAFTIMKDMYSKSIQYFFIVNAGAMFWLIFSTVLAASSIENMGVFRLIGYMQSSLAILGMIVNSNKLGFYKVDIDRHQLADKIFLYLGLFMISFMNVFYIFTLIFVNDFDSNLILTFNISISVTCSVTLLHSLINENYDILGDVKFLMLMPVVMVLCALIGVNFTNSILIGYMFEVIIILIFYFALKRNYYVRFKRGEYILFFLIATQGMLYVL